MNININRMHERIGKLAKIGSTAQGGARRLALTDADKDGRDLLVSWMTETGLDVSIDPVGNIFAILKGKNSHKPIMTGSHIDTVGNGGHLDGCLGVIAGLECIAAFVDNNIVPEHDLCVAIFTNEEGVRFQPDMLGSLAYVGGMSIDDAHNIISTDGISLKEELKRTGYLGDMEYGSEPPHAFVELHIEQGPILERKNIEIGAVENVQGISWTNVIIKGQANHAGTTPMNMRRDAGYAAGLLTVKIREIAEKMGTGHVGTVGVINPKPNLINVVAGEVQMTVDLRNVDEEKLKCSEKLFSQALDDIRRLEDVEIKTEILARFEPVKFDERISSLITETATELGLSNMTMNSGAGHDAQMMARICPAAMIFVPSRGGISHNPKEYTQPDQINAGAALLFKTIMKLDQGYLTEI